MKCVKHIVLSLMVLLVIGVCINNNKLLSFAEDQVYTRDSFKEGEYLLSGDYFKYDFQVSNSYCTDVPIYFYLEHNDIKYTNYISHNSGVLEGDIDYYRGIPLLNKDSFEQKNTNEIPYVNGKTILWELHGTGTLFGYCYSDLVFFGKVYEEPKFELLCDSTEMGPDDKVACQVVVDYSEIPNKIEFELSSDKFNIEDIKTLDGWKKTDDDKFIFESVFSEK